jgi:hypothetical protein
MQPATIDSLAAAHADIWDSGKSAVAQARNCTLYSRSLIGEG